MGPTGTRYTSSMCLCFCNGYHRYQICSLLGCGVAIYGYHGYQVYFFCVSVFALGTTGTNYVLYWGVG